jgi:hypothetical protein
MSESRPPPNGYEQHADEQRRAIAALTPLQRLQWLQQAKEFAAKYLGAAGKASARPKAPAR